MTSYQIVIKCDNEHTQMEWWGLLDAYIEYLEKIHVEIFDDEGWTIKKEVVE